MDNQTNNQTQSRTAALLNQIRQRREEVAACKELFTSLWPDIEAPEDRQFQLWLQRHKSLDIVVAGLERAFEWFCTIDGKTEKLKAEGKGVPAAMRKAKTDILAYASGVMIRVERGEDGHGAPVAKAEVSSEEIDFLDESKTTSFSIEGGDDEELA